MRRSTKITLLLLAMATGAAVADAAHSRSAAAAGPTGRLVTAPLAHGAKLHIWRSADGGLYLRVDGYRAVDSINGTTITTNDDGGVLVERYPNEAMLDRRIKLVYGMSATAMGRLAVRSGLPSSIPARVLTALAAPRPAETTIINHAAVTQSGLATLSGVLTGGVVTFGRPASLPLVANASVSDSDAEVSSTGIVLQYSSDATDPALGSKYLTVSEYSPSDPDGKADLNHVANQAVFSAGGVSAYQPNNDATDMIFELGGTVVVVSASWEPTATEWRAILSGASVS
jgi:hypothetical protein